MKILGISGSIRKDSYNKSLLQAAAEMLPESVTMEFIDCGTLPLYNSDLDGEQKPESVIRLKQAIHECDGILFASPEYNYSISGVLKMPLTGHHGPPINLCWLASPQELSAVQKVLQVGPG